jgi:hypothetical protein
LPVTSFAEITADPALQAELQAVFGNVNNIDAFVGALAEDHLPQSSAGPLLTAIVNQQFLRLRDGDRFFYTRDGLLTDPQVRTVVNMRNVSLAQVIKWNTGISNIQDEVFFDSSVMVVRARPNGVKVAVGSTPNTVAVVDLGTGQVVDSGSLSALSTIILAGSRSSADVFNVVIGAAAGGLEGGVVAYGGGTAGDRLNVYGLPGNDTFAVTGATVTNNITSAADADVVVTRSVDVRGVTVNGNSIFGTGFETLRLVTLGGTDTISDPGGFATVVSVWDPTRTD